MGGGREVDSLRGQVQELQQQNHKMELDVDRQRHEHDRVVQQLGEQLQGQRVLIEAKTRKVQQLQRIVQLRESWGRIVKL